jgi:hypothetical protein
VILWSMVRISWLVGTLAVAFRAQAQNPMDCVREITMPNTYFFVSPLIPATIEVHITIGTNGKALSVDYGNAKPTFRTELDEYFIGTARYVEACAGKTINFTVRYVVEGQRTSIHSSEVRFKPPNEIIIVCHPLEPAVDPYRKKSVRR